MNRLWFFLDTWRVDGAWITLDTLEQRIIRPRHEEPRAHFALVCGAMGCPPLLDEPFAGDRLDEQLDSLGRQWFLEDDAVRVDADGTVSLSLIFKWYRSDFDSMGGLAGVVDRYMPGDHRDQDDVVEAARTGRIRFMPYDWTINDVRVPRSREGRVQR